MVTLHRDFPTVALRLQQRSSSNNALQLPEDCSACRIHFPFSIFCFSFFALPFPCSFPSTLKQRASRQTLQLKLNQYNLISPSTSINYQNNQARHANTQKLNSLTLSSALSFHTGETCINHVLLSQTNNPTHRASSPYSFGADVTCSSSFPPSSLPFSQRFSQFDHSITRSHDSLTQ